MSESVQNGVFSWPVTTPTYDVGANRQLRLSSLLRWQQEAGEQQLIGYGMDWGSLSQRGLAFVLARAGGEIFRMPSSGEAVRLETWQRKVEGVQFFRGYRLLDAQGHRLTETAATFALVDVNTHRLLKPAALAPQSVPSVEREDAHTISKHVRLPELSPVGEWVVPHSAVDFNRHLNNTVYADLLTDFLPPDRRDDDITGYALHYNHEVREDERLQLFSAAEGSEQYLEGRVGTTVCFTGKVMLKTRG